MNTRNTMNLAKVTTNRQITVPIDIYRLLGLQPGNKILFTEEKDGRITISKAQDPNNTTSAIAVQDARNSLLEDAIKLGLDNDEAIIRLVQELRYDQKA